MSRLKSNTSPVLSILLWPFRLVAGIIKAILLAIFIIIGWYFLQVYGVLPVQVPVSGASMLPTLPEEGFVSFQRYPGYPELQEYVPLEIKKGDIVVFDNDKTFEELQKQHKDGTGFVKRVIATEGDMVEIRDGFVYVNGEPLKEKYTLQPRSTFGGTEIQDCKKVEVTKDQLFVLGDNRKVSLDSRQLGLISKYDVDFYIPYEKQVERFASNWRDPTDDLEAQHESLFDVDKYVALLNQERKEEGLKPLEYQPLLEQSAELRAEAMLEHDDFSFDAQKSGYTMKEALNDVGYGNVIYGEFPMTGYYSAEELFEAFLERPGSSEFLLNEDYDEIGVSTFVGELNGCPVQVVVQHLAGYVPPNYSAAQISSWKEGLEKLRSIQPGWAELKEAGSFYEKNKQNIDRINEIISTRISRFQQIVNRMEANQWLTDEEKQWMEQDKDLNAEQNRIAEELNNS